MRFPCKDCGGEIINNQLDSKSEFFHQDCPHCGSIHTYSWLRIQQIVEKT